MKTVVSRFYFTFQERTLTHEPLMAPAPTNSSMLGVARYKWLFQFTIHCVTCSTENRKHGRQCFACRSIIIRPADLLGFNARGTALRSMMSGTGEAHGAVIHKNVKIESKRARRRVLPESGYDMTS